jgi:PknH-like extracellular domain
VRQQIAGLVLASVCALTVGCTSVVNGKAVPADKSGPVTEPPLSISALDGLLLDVGQINAALGAASMKVWFEARTMWDWSSSINDKNCLAVDGPAQAKVYADTGWSGIRGQRIDDSVDGSKNRSHYTIQAVISFPSAHDASAFYDSSGPSWSACSNRRFSDVNPGKPDTVWTVAGITKDSGMLSTSQVQEGGDGWACQRALTARNNIAIDIVTCSFDPVGGAAIDIATQIAAKVTKQ